MFKGKFFIIFVLIILMIVFQSCKLNSGPAYDILARSTDFEDVQAAVDSALSGDIVRIPRGNSTWISRLEIPDDKKITLSGSGQEETVISSDTSEPGSLINMGSSGSRVTNMGFKLANDNGNGITVRGEGWRIDHCRFDNNIGNIIEGVSARGYPSDGGCPVGLVDHCEFNNTRALVVGDASLMANSIWAEPLGLGTNNAVFIEDCIFNYTQFSNAIDANYGGRYVFRYNIINDAYIEAHSLQGTHRATRSWEVYENTINQVERAMWAPFFLRGGTGVVFNNTITGDWSSGPAIVVDNRRTFEALGDGGLADGTSPWDGNEDSTGYPARDQIGRSTDEWLWTDENPYPPQELDPFYQWNNTHEGSNIEVYVHNNCGAHIKENRDYYNNLEKPGYTPYTYPHPLIEEWEGE
ncbi:hypothetical protein JW879_04940 [candidate division WOR-3 bacterium]|nr:hypothetical protein [candidate division WOR-3 bacterium]